MRVLHTSDWHLGRNFGPYSLDADQRAFTDWFVGQVQDRAVDLVVIAGDVFDRAVAPSEAIAHFRTVLSAIRSTGARVAVITGNHDGPDRVATYHELLDGSGVLLRGGYTGVGEVVTLDFSDGPLDLVLLPYLDPQLAPAELGGVGPESEDAEISAGGEVEASYRRRMRRTHESVLRDAVERAIPHLASGRSLAVSHAFVAGGQESDSERVLVVGGTAAVPVEVFAPFSYTALGHLHRPQQVGSPTVRYSGTPLRYSFSEDHDKSVTVIELAPDGEVEVEEIPVPVGRRVRTVTGRIDELLGGRDPDDADYFVRVILTDPGVVLDAKARLSARWPGVVEIERRPEGEGEVPGEPGDARQRRHLTREEKLIAYWQAATTESPTEDELAVMTEELNALVAREAV